MAVNVAAMAAGRLLSSLTAVRLWTAGGLTANTLVSAAAVSLALAILMALIREGKPGAAAAAPSSSL
jgi:hypothetical protein